MRALGEPFTPEESAEFLRLARTLVRRRVKFRHMGRDPRTGMDCAGMPLWIADTMGKPTVDISAYGREPHRDGLREALNANLGHPVSLPSLRPSDVVLMRFAGDPRHVGILGDYPEGGLSLIHIHSTLKFAAEHRLDDSWRKNIVAGWRP